MKSCVTTRQTGVFWAPDDDLRASCCTRNIFKTLALFEKSTFLPVLGRFCVRTLWRGLNGKCQSFVRDLNFWPALHTPGQFSQKAQGTGHLLSAFWTAGFTARQPGIGSASCYTIFQVSNRTIGCILDRSGGCSENFVWICLSPAGWLGQRLDVQLFSHEIYAANPLFCAHSAVVSWRATCRVSDRHIFHEHFGRNGVNMGQNLVI